MAFTKVAYGADSSNSGIKPSLERSAEQAHVMRIRLKIESNVITATLVDSETARDFVSLLPLTLTMEDLFGREKFAHLPRAISEGGQRTRTYAVGDLIYWSPGPDVAIYYRHDGQTVPSPGIITIAKIESGMQALNVSGSVKVTLELDAK
ncbi:hypothetical protein CWS72_13140 [Telmatospirillum siberiense]|uniref:Cyclophilin-like domain-containing protein n=2 Tax=Telmatospirillum siberiense TaxID=382514 RepID=A0A2N3PUQ4_9PROT|nr:hypothetical protein CWS72_13140 [Telmatospirillum siberiense]